MSFTLVQHIQPEQKRKDGVNGSKMQDSGRNAVQYSCHEKYEKGLCV